MAATRPPPLDAERRSRGRRLTVNAGTCLAHGDEDEGGAAGARNGLAARSNVVSIGVTSAVSMPAFASAPMRSPLLTNGTGARLADIEPPRDVDLEQVELEHRVTRDGLDHAADAARHDDRVDHGPGRPVACHLARGRANAESSSSGPGSAWITHRGSRRRSHPFGDERGIAANSRPPARIGQKG